MFRFVVVGGVVCVGILLMIGLLFVVVMVVVVLLLVVVIVLVGWFVGYSVKIGLVNVRIFSYIMMVIINIVIWIYCDKKSQVISSMKMVLIIC